MGVYEQVKAVFDSYGVPEWIWYPIAIVESGGDPNKVFHESNGTTSYGLFQLNSGGQGSGFSSQQLLDPVTNAQIAAKEISKAWNAVKASIPSAPRITQLFDVAQQSGHPLPLEKLLPTLTRFLQNGPDPSFGTAGANVFSDIGTAGQGLFPSIGGQLGALLNSMDWVRVGIGLAGVVLIILALAAFLWKPAQEVVGTAAKAVA